MTIEEFGKTIKQKYPEYSDIDDATLGTKMLAKYPQYKDMVSGGVTTPPTTTSNKGILNTSYDILNNAAQLNYNLGVGGLKGIGSTLYTIPKSAERVAGGIIESQTTPAYQSISNLARTTVNLIKQVRTMPEGKQKDSLNNIINQNLETLDLSSETMGEVTEKTTQLESLERPAYLTPQGTAQKVGFTAERIGEFFIPAGKEREMAKSLDIITKAEKGSTTASKIMGAATRITGKSLYSGYFAGLVNLAQTGDVKQAAKTAENSTLFSLPFNTFTELAPVVSNWLKKSASAEYRGQLKVGGKENIKLADKVSDKLLEKRVVFSSGKGLAEKSDLYIDDLGQKIKDKWAALPADAKVDIAPVVDKIDDQIKALERVDANGNIRVNIDNQPLYKKLIEYKDEILSYKIGESNLGKVSPTQFKTVDEYIKAQGTPVYHGTSGDNAIKISQEGFRVGVGKGISSEAGDFVFATPNKQAATRYVSDRLGIKNPTTVEGIFSGKVLEINGKMADYEAMGGASKKLGVPLGIDSRGESTMLDIPAIQSAMKKQGYGAIQFSDKYANGSKALAVLPEQIKTKPQLIDEWNNAQNLWANVKGDSGILEYKRSLDDAIQKAKHGFSTVQDLPTAEARNTAANLLRDELNKNNPDVAELNKAFNFWKNVQTVGENIKNPVTGKTAAELQGAAIGIATGNVKATLLISTIFGLVKQAVRSPLWKTIDAVNRAKIADAIIKVDPAIVPVLNRIIFGTKGSLKSMKK